MKRKTLILAVVILLLGIAVACSGKEEASEDQQPKANDTETSTNDDKQTTEDGSTEETSQNNASKESDPEVMNDLGDLVVKVKVDLTSSLEDKDVEFENLWKLFAFQDSVDFDQKAALNIKFSLKNGETITNKLTFDQDFVVYENNFEGFGAKGTYKCKMFDILGSVAMATFCRNDNGNEGSSVDVLEGSSKVFDQAEATYAQKQK